MSSSGSVLQPATDAALVTGGALVLDRATRTGPCPVALDLLSQPDDLVFEHLAFIVVHLSRINLCQPTPHLGTSRVFVAVVDRLELATVDRHQRVVQQAELAAQRLDGTRFR